MSPLNHPGLRNFFSGRRRFQLAWIFAVLLIVRAHHYPYAFGTIICFLGATLRFVSSGYLRKESKLAVGGPYQFTRNPLYLGTFIMALGAAMSVGAFGLALLMGFIFFLNYHYVIESEEQKLPNYFGAAYLKYCGLVPRFFPRFTKPARSELLEINSDLEVYKFSYPLAVHNKAFEAYISFAGIIAAMIAIVFVKYKLGAIR